MLNLCVPFYPFEANFCGKHPHDEFSKHAVVVETIVTIPVNNVIPVPSSHLCCYHCEETITRFCWVHGRTASEILVRPGAPSTSAGKGHPTWDSTWDTTQHLWSLLTSLHTPFYSTSCLHSRSSVPKPFAAKRPTYSRNAW